MKAYKLKYNEDDNSYGIVSFEIAHSRDFSHDPDTNLSDNMHSHFEEAGSAENAAVSLNRKIAAGELSVHKCMDCGKFFEITEDERHWFRARSLNVPKRCLSCRNKKRKNR